MAPRQDKERSHSWAHRQIPTRCSIVLLFLLGCGGIGPGTEPDAMSSDDHRQQAAELERQAREHARRSDVRVGNASDERFGHPEGIEQYNSTDVYRRLARFQQQRAREHLEAARILEEFEEAECGAFTPEIRVACPLLGQVDGLEDISNGVRVRLSEGTDPDAAITHMRCHLAFARSRGRVGMQECPLYLQGVRVEPVEGSRSIDLVSDNPDDLEALRRRTVLHTSDGEPMGRK